MNKEIYYGISNETKALMYGLAIGVSIFVIGFIMAIITRGA